MELAGDQPAPLAKGMRIPCGYLDQFRAGVLHAYVELCSAYVISTHRRAQSTLCVYVCICDGWNMHNAPCPLGISPIIGVNKSLVVVIMHDYLLVRFVFENPSLQRGDWGSKLQRYTVK